MGEKITLNIAKREVFGKKVAKLRKEGTVPGVVYGAGIEPQAIQMELGAVSKVISAAGKHTPVHLTGAKRRIAMIKDIDMDMVRHQIRHVAFHAVKADEPVIAEVPVRLIDQGESDAEKAGLIILQAIESLEVKALPMDLPEALEISVKNLKTDEDKLTVGDIELPEGVELVDNDDGREGTADDDQSVTDLVVANVYEPGALAAANEAAGGDAEDESEVESENGSEETPADSESEDK